MFQVVRLRASMGELGVGHLPSQDTLPFLAKAFDASGTSGCTKSRHWIAPYAAFVMVIMDQEDRVGGERTTCASTASSLNLRKANARRPLPHSGFTRASLFLF
jgi:hypothetical protein